jgi:pimeloyl-ACP methyl ester carboxylesterase
MGAIATPSVVLVHGTFVDGSGWRQVHDALTHDGYSVAVVQNPTVSLRDDAAATRLVLDLQRGPTVLVGHSYPDSGESVNTLIGGFPAHTPQMPGLPSRDGFVFQDPAKFHASFGVDLADDVAAFMAASQTPWGTEAGDGTITDPAWRTRPSWYLVANQDREIPPASQRAMAQRAGSTVVERAATHAVYITQPLLVADLIAAAVAAVSR